MKLSIPQNEKESVLNELKKFNLKFQNIYPGDKPDRQPVHTVYGGANLFKSDSMPKMGMTALRSFATYAPDFAVLARVLEMGGHEGLPKTATQAGKLAEQLDRMDEAERKKN